MIQGIVRIKDLGRDKVNRTFPVCAVDEEDFNAILEREFRKHLLSTEVSFSDGMIFAGMRNVGNFEFIAKKVK